MDDDGNTFFPLNSFSSSLVFKYYIFLCLLNWWTDERKQAVDGGLHISSNHFKTLFFRVPFWTQVDPCPLIISVAQKLATQSAKSVFKPKFYS